MKLKLNRSIAKLVCILLAVIVTVSLIFVALRAWEKRYASGEPAGTEETAEMQGGAAQAEETEETGTQLYQNSKWYKGNKNLETVLLIGLDKYEEAIPEENIGDRNDQRSDFLLLLLLDHEKKTLQAVHVNRDTMAEIRKNGVGGGSAGTVTEQLALAHTYGNGGEDSCENTANAVSGFLYGSPIDHYVSVTMDAVPEVTDLVGGVELTVMDDFSAVDPAMKKDAALKLSGKQALIYVRGRSELEEPTNVRRMERQRQYIESLRKTAEEKMKTEEAIVADVMLTATPYMVTDLPAEDLNRIGTCVMEYENKGIRTIEGEAVKGNQYMEFYADEEKLKELVLELFYVEAEE